MTSFKEVYYGKVFESLVKELADSGLAFSKEVNEPFLNLLESSLYKALDFTFADLQKAMKKEDDNKEIQS